MQLCQQFLMFSCKLQNIECFVMKQVSGPLPELLCRVTDLIQSLIQYQQRV